jgi:flavin-dependent dehydrogenase
MISRETGTSKRYNAVIVGARCAGAATAMLLARQGLDVLAIDRSEYGSDALSTHALMRGAVMQLQSWGLVEAVKASGATPVRKTSFHYGEERVEVQIKAGYGVDALYAPRRKVLDRILVDAAREAGANIRFGCVADSLLRAANGAVSGVVMRDENGQMEEISASIVIGADGARSTVAREAGAKTLFEGRSATAVVYGYFEDIADEGYRWGFGPDMAYGVIPTNDDATLVFAGVPARKYRETYAGDLGGGFRRILETHSPRLAAELRQAKPIERLRGYTGMKGFMRQPYGPGWALVGDAGYFRDPVTAHGITDALRDADLLARAVVSGPDFGFAEYRYLRDALSRPLLDVSDAIASFEWSMDEVKWHHVVLNEAMKVETAVMHRLRAMAPIENSRNARDAVGVVAGDTAA